MPKSTSQSTKASDDDVIMLDENDELPELVDMESKLDLTGEATNTSPESSKQKEPEMTTVQSRKRRAKNRDVFMEDVEEKKPQEVMEPTGQSMRFVIFVV